MADPDARSSSASAVFRIFFALGLTSFGGPVAHLGYFREAFVVRRGWLDERTYADLVALCQFLPGPASSQVGMAIGLRRAGLGGALAAWAGFTLPSAVLLTAVGIGVIASADTLPNGLRHGLALAAVPVVAHAVWGMGRSLCPDRRRRTLAFAGAVSTLVWPSVAGQLVVIVAGALAGLGWVADDTVAAAGGTPGAARRAGAAARPPAGQGRPPAPGTKGSTGQAGRMGEPAGRVAGNFPRPLALAALTLFGLLLLGLPLLAALIPESLALARADGFFRAGALVFGGGHVVLPLLHAEVVPPGWVTGDDFLAGYGLAQAVPGPLFTFAAYLGAVMQGAPTGLAGATLCLLAIFAPSFLLVPAVMPFWERLRGRRLIRQALAGVNAAVVGLLLAALYDPVWTKAVRGSGDVAVVFAAFALLSLWRVPPWLVVLLTALAGWAVGGDWFSVVRRV